MVDSTGAFSSSGSLTDTSYTIEGLESTTIYTITVSVSNTAGSTDSQPIIVSTGMCLIFKLLHVYNNVILQLLVPTTEEYCAAENIGTCSETDNTPAIIGGVVAIVFILVAALIVIVLLLRNRRIDYKMKAQK